MQSGGEGRKERDIRQIGNARKLGNSEEGIQLQNSYVCCKKIEIDNAKKLENSQEYKSMFNGEPNFWPVRAERGYHVGC